MGAALSGADARSGGRVFDAIADGYDRHRPTYLNPLIDRACQVAGLGPGSLVLEVGCGTGQLTRSLLARGLRVTAVEPGERLITRAREQLEGAGEVRFIHGRLEDVSLPRAHYDAVLAASAIHWIDPEVSWRTAAEALVDGGTLALISYFGSTGPEGGDDQRALRACLARVGPGLADWPVYRDLEATVAGARQRGENVSELWAWLGGYEIARGYAGRLFEGARIDTWPMLLEHTATELNALMGTMSFWARLSPGQRRALAAETTALYERLGRPIRSSTIACLVTARRAPGP